VIGDHVGRADRALEFSEVTGTCLINNPDNVVLQVEIELASEWGSLEDKCMPALLAEFGAESHTVEQDGWGCNTCGYGSSYLISLYRCTRL
jgi:hypothetical protein